ncbi:hypothetical protein ABK040_001442 [Willaertia magna]
MSENQSSSSTTTTTTSSTIMRSKGTQSPERERNNTSILTDLSFNEEENINSTTSSTVSTPRRKENTTAFSTPNNNRTTPYSGVKTISFISSLNSLREESNNNSPQDLNVLNSVKAKYGEKTPNIVKSEARTLLKKLDTDEVLSAIEQLYVLCLFHENRNNMLDTGILSNITLVLKTRESRIKEYAARILQLFAQDGGETCVQLKRLNLCNAAIDILAKSDDYNVKVPVVGLIYWLIQNPSCKKEFNDMGAETYLKEISGRTKDPMLLKYLTYAIHSLSSKVKSREELLEEALSQNANTNNNSDNNNTKEFIYVNPRHFYGSLKASTVQTSSPSTPKKKLELLTPIKPSSGSQTDKSSTQKQVIYESDESDVIEDKEINTEQ